MLRSTALLFSTAFLMGLGEARSQHVGATPTYRVYPMPIESPHHTTPTPPADARELIVDPSDPLASPFMWHDDDGQPDEEYTTTRGNNALVHFDGVFADGGPDLAFDFPIDLTLPPFESADAVLTNLFYWTNLFHDVLYRYGFDEAAGNAQQNNYGNGGVAGDPIDLKGHTDHSGSTVFVPNDGGSPLVTITLLDPGPPFGVPAWQNLGTVHLLAHVPSIRLTGGPHTTTCLLNDEQMGEGWSDWYGLMLTMRADDDRNTLRLEDGFLPAPYTTDFTVNDFTYGDTPIQSIPFGVGFVWGTILWELTWDLIDAFGFDPDLYDADGTAGNQIALLLVTEAMKLQPCSPGFVDARNAVLAADQSLYGGAYEELLWNAFARRGLGLSADQGSPNTNADNIEAFDSPFPVGNETIRPAAAPLRISGISPNPATAYADVLYTAGAPGPVLATIFDARGRRLMELAGTADARGNQRLRVDVGRLPPGFYVARLRVGSETATKGFTVMRRP